MGRAALQVNEYPGQRTFKAIGTGNQDFVVAMTACVEQVVGKVHEECISQRLVSVGASMLIGGCRDQHDLAGQALHRSPLGVYLAHVRTCSFPAAAVGQGQLHLGHGWASVGRDTRSDAPNLREHEGGWAAALLLLSGLLEGCRARHFPPPILCCWRWCLCVQACWRRVVPGPACTIALTFIQPAIFNPLPIPAPSAAHCYNVCGLLEAVLFP